MMFRATCDVGGERWIRPWRWSQWWSRRLLANDMCSSGDQIIEPFTAVEATAPPAEVHGRDELC
jgi:hypothetical protein